MLFRSVDDLLELDPPERTTDFRPDNLAQNTGRYVDEELGFSFFPPIGWAVSNPEIGRASCRERV